MTCEYTQQMCGGCIHTQGGGIGWQAADRVDLSSIQPLTATAVCAGSCVIYEGPILVVIHQGVDNTNKHSMVGSHSHRLCIEQYKST